MPGLNQTGPMGEGAMTGRRMGRCTNFGTKSKKEDNQQQGKGSQTLSDDLSTQSGTGRRFRFGRGQGQRGKGMGFRNRFSNNI